MGPDLVNSGEPATFGYDRAAVEDFLRAAAEERERLQREIDSSNMRLARARTALGTHRVMVAMLLETQRELSTMRRDAEREAADIIGAAEREARARENSSEPTSSAPPIDLRATSFAPPESVSSSAEDVWSSTSPSYAGREPLSSGGVGEDTDYFEFLRGALHDEEPLGPRAE
jgi:hypothetical protein